MNRRAILILGMHRSGTSALARVVGHLGASLPLAPMPETADNPSGYWESRPIARFNTRLLESAGTRWNDDGPVTDAWFADAARRTDVYEAVELLAAEFGEVPLLVLKDPRICRLLPFWREVLARAGIDACAVLSLRDPWEVARSLQARLADTAFRPAAIAAPERGLLLWLRHVLDAEARSRDMPRTVIHYKSLVADWRSAVRELLDLASLPPVSAEAAAAVEQFLTPELRRQRDTDAVDQRLALSVEVLRAIAKDVQQASMSACRAEPTRRRLDTIARSLDRLVFAYAPLRQGPEATTPADPWAGAILAEIGRTPQRAAAPPNRRRALFLSGAPLSAGHVYRVEHAVAALTVRGWKTSVLPLDDSGVAEALKAADLVMVFRAKWGEQMARVRERASARRIPLAYDIDDLVFDPAVMATGQIAFIAGLPETQRQRWFDDAALYRRAIAASDACIVTTPALAAAVGGIGPDVHLLPNGLGTKMLAAAEQSRGLPKPSSLDGLLRVGFASGTPTHHRDFATIARPLADLLARREDVRLVIVGHLDVGAVPELAGHLGRIEVRPAVSLLEVFTEVARFDINLAPLEVGNPFCEAKSPIRCFTAAVVGVPSIVAATGPLVAAVIDAETGTVARSAEDWTMAIDSLLDDSGRRERMGEAARIDVIARSGPEAIVEQTEGVYTGILAYWAPKSWPSSGTPLGAQRVRCR
ncbi:MAG: glycosyltransferase [Rhodocyclaceae bacterium]|nr:glycosyltransferase [Rhodocyclaceae bacterium]